MVSKDAFKEDPLRLIRAFSLRAQLAFEIDRRTLAQIKKDKSLIKKVSGERIRDELFKILACENTAENFKIMDKIGLLKEIIPQIAVMYDVVQGGYHHLDVWNHSLETVAQLEKVFAQTQSDADISAYLKEIFGPAPTRFALMKLAALLHDIGKPKTRKKEKGKTSFHGHERVGKGMVKNISLLLKLSTKERYILEDMTLFHLRPGYLSDFKYPSRKAIFRYFRDAKEEAVGILLLSLADQRATRGPLTTEADQRHHERIIRDLIKQYFERAKAQPMKRLIDGNDLIRRLKLKPAPIFSKILREIEEKQATGLIRTKVQALKLAREIAGRNP